MQENQFFFSLLHLIYYQCSRQMWMLAVIFYSRNFCRVEPAIVRPNTMSDSRAVSYYQPGHKKKYSFWCRHQQRKVVLLVFIRSFFPLTSWQATNCTEAPKSSIFIPACVAFCCTWFSADCCFTGSERKKAVWGGEADNWLWVRSLTGSISRTCLYGYCICLFHVTSQGVTVLTSDLSVWVVSLF